VIDRSRAAGNEEAGRHDLFDLLLRDPAQLDLNGRLAFVRITLRLEFDADAAAYLQAE
jgi:hypothetical protein